MQSFLQYRRFGKHVAAQYERDKSKAEALGDPDTSSVISPSSSKDEASSSANLDKTIEAQDYAGTRDPEKGEQSPGPTQSHDLDGDKQDGGYEPIRATPSGRQGPIAEEEMEHMSRASTTATRKSLGTALGTTLTGINVRDRSSNEGGEGKVFVVGYEGEKDIMNPHNWSFVTKFGATYVLLDRLPKQIT